MLPHLISVSLVALALALAPGSATARTRDASRFAAFAAGARVSGTLHFAMRFEGDRERCAEAGTCGISGTASARLRLDRNRPARVRGDVVSLPVRGTATGRVRDLVAGRGCADSEPKRRAGLAFAGDGHGLLLRPGPAGADAGIDDPLATACRAPDLASFGTAALGSIRLRTVMPRVNRLRVMVRTRRIVSARGFAATITTAGTLVFKR
ncbi:MAG TPA: hypothetical protein VGJ32_12180 [Solirubrobacteraceae bacterium]|jgi:hypothetical protein